MSEGGICLDYVTNQSRVLGPSPQVIEKALWDNPSHKDFVKAIEGHPSRDPHKFWRALAEFHRTGDRFAGFAAKMFLQEAIRALAERRAGVGRE